LVCHFHRTISRRSYDQLGALKPLVAVACPLWWNGVHARQHLHDLPPDGRLVAPDQDQILPLIAAISWRPVQHDAPRRARLEVRPWRHAATIRGILFDHLGGAAVARPMISSGTSYCLDCRHCVGGTKDSGEQEVALHHRKTAPKSSECCKHEQLPQRGSC
jgi:hypothetical protein